jgi:hypothetical protein
MYSIPAKAERRKRESWEDLSLTLNHCVAALAKRRTGIRDTCQGLGRGEEAQARLGASLELD